MYIIIFKINFWEWYCFDIENTFLNKFLLYFDIVFFKKFVLIYVFKLVNGILNDW